MPPYHSPSLADRCSRVCIRCREELPSQETDKQPPNRAGASPGRPNDKGLGPWSARLLTSTLPRLVTQYALFTPETLACRLGGKGSLDIGRYTNKASRDPLLLPAKEDVVEAASNSPDQWDCPT